MKALSSLNAAQKGLGLTWQELAASPLWNSRLLTVSEKSITCKFLIRRAILRLSDVIDTSAWVATVSRDWQGSRKLQPHRYQALLALVRRLIPAWEGHHSVQGLIPPLPMDQGLQLTPLSAALSAQRRADRRQPKEVWQAFRRLVLLPHDLDFTHTCLWKKLSLGARLRAIWPSI